MNNIKEITHIDNVRLRDDDKAVVILDQSLLPQKTVYLDLEKPKEMYDAIFHLKVRGGSGNRYMCSVLYGCFGVQ